MEIETKFLRVFRPVAIGDRIDGWRVCWIGGWNKCRVLFVVMVDRPLARGAIPAFKLRKRFSFLSGPQARS